MKIKIPFYLLAVSFIVACSSPTVDLGKEIEALMLTKTHTPETRAKLAMLQEDFVAQFPEDSLTQVYLENLSFYNLNVDSTAKATKYAQQYVNAYPTSDNAQDIELVIAKAYNKEGRYLEAIEVFERVQNKGPLSIADSRKLGSALMNASQDSTAANSDFLYYKWAALQEQIDGLPGAIKAYEGFIETFPASGYMASALTLYADKLERNGDIEAAKKTLQRLVSDYPESPQAGTARTMLEKDLVGLSAEEQLERILADKATN